MNILNKNIGILGGAFNPIHLGHIEIAENVLNETSINEIWFLPSFNPPHKDLCDEKNFLHRCEMIKIAIRNYNNFLLNNIELSLYKNKIFNINSSYNIINYIKNNYNNISNIYIIIGLDELNNIENWLEASKLLNEFKFVLVKRNNKSFNYTYLNYLRNKYNFKYQLIEKSILNCSSTEIKNDLKNGIKSKYLDKYVYEYIIKNKVYE